jgi:site-specific recombinase XerD
MLEAPHTKSKRRRSIPINEEVRKALLNRWNWTRQHCPETPWVFCEESGQRLGDVKRSFKTACRRSNIVDFHIHDLRHTCAAWLVTAGASLSAVRDLLGHTTVETTEIYAHLSPEAVREAVGKLNGCHTERHTDHTETYLEMVR